MKRYIGVDAHASSCTLGIVCPSGKRLGSRVVETNARALIEVLHQIPRNRHVCLEEGTLSGWLYEVLEAHVEELVVAGVRESRGPKSDERDAFALAEQLRIGSLETRVYKGRGKFGRLGHVARAYGFVARDGVRVKNRLKSVRTLPLRAEFDGTPYVAANEATYDPGRKEAARQRPSRA